MARRQRRDKQKTLAKAALFAACIRRRLPSTLQRVKISSLCPRTCPAQWTTALAPATSSLSECASSSEPRTREIIIDVSAGSTRQCANMKAAGEQVINNIFTDKPGSARHRDSLIHARDSCT